jgi:hypothetical protein
MTTPSTATIPGYVAGTWNIDPVHSEVGFSVRHMMVSKVRGKFDTFSGQIVTGEELLSSSVPRSSWPRSTPATSSVTSTSGRPTSSRSRSTRR